MGRALNAGALRRRTLLAGAGAGAGLASLGGLTACAVEPLRPLPPPGPSEPVPAEDSALLDDLEQRTVGYFRATTPASGLAPDRWPSPSFCSIAAVGFSLSAHIIGAEQGWIARDTVRELTLTTLRFFRDAPQGPAARGTAGHRGFFYHFLDAATGTRFGQCELSTVDTALLLAGVLHAAACFGGNHAAEAEIRRAAELISERVDWRWAQHRPPSICHGWHPETGFIPSDWKGYNEAMLVYLLALGSPRQPVDTDAWAAWTSTYGRSWQAFHGPAHLHFAPLFGHQYTHCWVDFRGIADAYTRERGTDYFQNSRHATLAQRAYAQANPLGWRGYGGDIWGITACDGPADVRRPFNGELRRFISYAGRGAGGHDSWDDGTLAPTAALASLPFAPQIVVPALRALRTRYGHAIYAQHGFVDSFNPSFDFADVRLQHGRLVPGLGWVDTDHLGIDQGPIALMAANHRRDSVWRIMRGNAQLRSGLLRAGFTGGWLAT
jgi:hypothetical protein